MKSTERVLWVTTLCLILPVTGIPSSSHLTSENGRVVDLEDYVDRYFMRFHYRVWEELSSHGVQPLGANCSCNLHPKIVTLFGRFKICNAPLLPSWALAVIIGLFFSYKFYSLGPQTTGSLSYTISYVMYAVMITSGLVVHCLFLVECGAQSINHIYVDVAKIDGSLTSCIAISFLFNTLVDAKLLPERMFGTTMVMVVVYVWVFYAYFIELVSPPLLYFATVSICCGLYIVFQFVMTIRNSFHAIGYLMASGIVGGVSLWLVKEEFCWLCLTLGAWSVEGVWYYGSDLAMTMVALYALKTRNRRYQSESGELDEKSTEKIMTKEKSAFHV